MQDETANPAAEDATVDPVAAATAAAQADGEPPADDADEGDADNDNGDASEGISIVVHGIAGLIKAASEKADEKRSDGADHPTAQTIGATVAKAIAACGAEGSDDATNAAADSAILAGINEAAGVGFALYGFRSANGYRSARMRPAGAPIELRIRITLGADMKWTQITTVRPIGRW